MPKKRQTKKKERSTSLKAIKLLNKLQTHLQYKFLEGSVIACSFDDKALALLIEALR